MNRRALYTCITGGYNELLPVPSIPDTDCIAFVQGATRHQRDGWLVLPTSGFGPARRAGSPRWLAKQYKLFPDLALRDYEATVWIDGTVRLDDPAFVDLALAVAEPSGLALWRHPYRDCIFSEAVVSTGMAKYRDEPIMSQVAHYQDQGHPVGGGLWACGILARWQRPEVNRLFRLWADEVLAWSVQDQLSFPVACRALGFVPGELPADLYANPWLTVTGHNPEF